MSAVGADGRDGVARITLRPIGTPAALGLAAILIGTGMLSGLQLHWLGGLENQRTVGFIALAASFPLELLAAVFAFLARDSLAGTGFGTFSTVWAVTGLSLLSGPPDATNPALGMFLIIDALILALLILSAGSGRAVFGGVLGCGCVRLALTGLYELAATRGLETAAAIAGLALAAGASYGIVALLTEDLPRGSLLPVGRSGRAASSITGSLRDQLDDLENEAGVRRQLQPCQPAIRRNRGMDESGKRADLAYLPAGRALGDPSATARRLACSGR